MYFTFFTLIMLMFLYPHCIAILIATLGFEILMDNLTSKLERSKPYSSFLSYSDLSNSVSEVQFSCDLLLS